MKDNLDKECFGIIYKAINIQNKKVYIGQTKYNLNKRISGHLNYSKNSDRPTLFSRAINKYGIKNFKWSIIGYCYSKEELNECEIECIKFFESINSIYGYNISLYNKCNYKNKIKKDKLDFDLLNELSKKSGMFLEKIKKEYNKIKKTNFKIGTLKNAMESHKINIPLYPEITYKIIENHMNLNKEIIIDFINKKYSLSKIIKEYYKLFNIKITDRRLNSFLKKNNIEKNKYSRKEEHSINCYQGQLKIINISFIIDLYFLNYDMKEITLEYNKIFKTNYNSCVFRLRFDLLNFPKFPSGNPSLFYNLDNNFTNKRIEFILNNQKNKKDFYYFFDNIENIKQLKINNNKD